MKARTVLSKLKNNIRGGVGSKGDPMEIKRAIVEATKDIHRAERDLGKISQDREELASDLARLHSYTELSGEDAPRSSYKRMLEKSIHALQKKLQDVSGVMPDFNMSEAQKKIQKIISEWKEEKKELRSAAIAHMKAERVLAKKPTEQKALGAANRSEAIIYDTIQKMNTTAKEAALVSDETTPNPVTDEAVNIHTGEEEDDAARKEAEQVALIRERARKESEARAREDNTPREDKSVQESALRVSADEIITSALAEVEQELGISAESSLAPLTHIETVPNQSVEQPIDIEAPVQDITPPFAEPELPAPEQHLLLEVGVPETEAVTMPEVFLPEFPSEAPAIPAPASEVIAEAPRPFRIEEQMAVEETPIEQPLPPAVDAMLRDHLNKLFGTKGILGFGAREGITSPHWADVAVGFAGKMIEEIRTARSFAIPQEDEPVFGVKNEQETTKMRGYLDHAMEETGVRPNKGETARAYLVRAITHALYKTDE